MQPRKNDPLADVKIIKKITDAPDLKEALIDVYEQKTHRDVASFAIALGEMTLQTAGLPPDAASDACFDIVRRWQRGEVKFQAARQVAFDIHRQAREEENPVRVKVLRTLGQIAATPHVKRHALIAADYAITLVNLLYPGDMARVRAMREAQLALMRTAVWEGMV